MTHYVGWLPVLAGFFPVYSMTFLFLFFNLSPIRGRGTVSVGGY